MRTHEAIYRVFGRRHPLNRVLLLLRYYRERSYWTKPPVYSYEAWAHPDIKRYDIPTTTVSQYGLTLGVGPATIPAYDEYYDPYSPLNRPQVIARLEETLQSPIGLTGSHLLGLQRPTSDLDIVLYGPSGPDQGRMLLKQHATSIDRPIEPSIAYKKFLTIFRGHDLNPEYRNVFTGLLGLGRETTKLDISYSMTDDPITTGNLLPANQIRNEHFRAIRVDNDSERYHFPGTLRGTATDGQPVLIYIKDHALHYVIQGDSIDLDGFVVGTEDADTLTVVGTNLLSTN